MDVLSGYTMKMIIQKKIKLIKRKRKNIGRCKTQRMILILKEYPGILKDGKESIPKLQYDRINEVQCFQCKIIYYNVA